MVFILYLVGHNPRHRADFLFFSSDERRATTAIGLLEHRKPNVDGRLTRSPDLRPYHKIAPLIPYELKWGSQSPTTDLNRNVEGYPTSGYSPHPID
jgi:hypothetical protein